MEEISKTTILQPLTLIQKSTDNSKEPEEDICVCLFCEHTEKNEKDNKKILSHIFYAHRLIISDAHEIADLKEYLAYWKEQFKAQTIEEFCTTMLLKQLPDGTKTENDEKYYLLADIVPRDKEIRIKLQKKLIEKALERHQFERSDKNFIRGCLFCRQQIPTTRYDYIEHLYSKHFLQLGRPENLVFVDELIDFIEEKLEAKICIYCEKIFKDRATLKEHMRKKGHKKINPDIKAYDRFFMINYKIKEDSSAQVSERKLPFIQKRNSEEDEEKVIFCNDDQEWSEWNEKENEILIICLFCSHKSENFDAILSHMQEVHKFNYEQVTVNFNFYQKVKLINYIRRKIHLKQCLSCEENFENHEMLLNHLNNENHLVCDLKSFDKPEFFFPTFEDDTFLCHLDSFNDEEDEMSEDSFGPVVSEDRNLTINEDAEMLSREKFIEI
ncbi:hypothetical protein PVAND_001232 [Polypedilum vanderplanki]|uniref:C2H2-type domain-containing protein n=1 Tax=Polypedilum vanderplanki TaxID=319348 RepID=A0A9J6BMR2_POLVA|nr:hypothetical protein PVAND_001232 [Polypedilum vanderplanki]